MPAPVIQLREYQRDAIRALFDWWRERKGEHPLIVLPTGAGKTYTVVALLRQLVADYAGLRVLILAHRRELLTQFEASIYDLWPLAPVGVYCATLGRRELCPVTIASRDSISRNPQCLGRFDVVVVDEAHNIDTTREETGYRRIIAALRALNPNLTLVGLTATPFRDTSGFIYGDGHLFAGVAHQVRLKWMIDNGHLVRPVSKQVAASIDTSGLRKMAGDFNRKQLDERASHLETVRDCLDEWERTAIAAQGRQSTLFFAVSVKHGRMISDELAARGYNVPLVTGETPKVERDNILADFAARELRGVVNVGVMTEGTDIPCIDVIALLRPTKSLKLFIQMVGRGLRLYPEKNDCLLLDFGGNLQRFGPVDIAEPETRKRSDDRTKDCPDCGSIVGYYKRKCPDCAYEFAPPLHKVCPECGEENAPGRRECIACGYEWPIDLDATASTDAAFSSDIRPRIEAFDVANVLVSLAQSKKTGREYLRITYVIDVLNRYYKNLMVGFGGYAGRKATDELRALMGPNVDFGIPETPGEAVNLHRDGWLLRPVSRIHVDTNSKYNEITNVEFTE